ncbi:MAG TPA: cytochrome C [Solibacterales bacterium]|nr:cytochrome C [Bryobacterales bacterium]
MMRPGAPITVLVLACSVLLIQACSVRESRTLTDKNGTAWRPPDPKAIPQGPVGDNIRLGMRIFNETPKYAAEFVGNRQNCSDCHIQGGAQPYAAPMVGLSGLFPMFNQRANRVITLEDRVEECFVRSESGRPLPYDSPKMVAVVSYVHWLSQGQVSGKPFPGRGFVKLPKLTPDAGNGAAVYRDQCSGCHGQDGAGKPPILPALWGPDAYNDGAGMNSVEKMAAFVQHNMPQNKPGTLSAQEAYDVAAYVKSKPHQRFNPVFASY